MRFGSPGLNFSRHTSERERESKKEARQISGPVVVGGIVVVSSAGGRDWRAG